MARFVWTPERLQSLHNLYPDHTADAMDAIELAKCFELCAVDHKPEGWPAIQQDSLNKAAAMLRKQREAIKTLREALADTAQSIVWKEFGECRGFTDLMPLPVVTAVEKAKQTLKDTEYL